MTPIAAILLLVLPAAVVGVAVLGAVVASGRRGGAEGRDAGPPAWARAAAPAAFAAALWSADFALHQAHALWPRDGTLRYLAVAAGAGVIGVVHALVGRVWFTAVLRGLLGIALAAAVLAPLAGGRYVAWPVFWGLVAAAGVWLAGAGWVLDRVDRGSPRLTAPLAMLLAAAAAAPGLYASRYAGGAQLFGGLSAVAVGALGARVLAGLFVRRGTAEATANPTAELAGGWTVWLSWYAAVLLVTYGYTDVPAVWVLPVLAMAPLGAGAGLLVRRGPAQLAASLAGVLALAVGGSVAAGLAAGDDGGGSPDEDGSYYGY